MERPHRFFALREKTSNSKRTERIPLCRQRSQLSIPLASGVNQSPLYAHCTPLDVRDGSSGNLTSSAAIAKNDSVRRSFLPEVCS